MTCIPSSVVLRKPFTKMLTEVLGYLDFRFLKSTSPMRVPLSQEGKIIKFFFLTFEGERFIAFFFSWCIDGSYIHALVESIEYEEYTRI